MKIPAGQGAADGEAVDRTHLPRHPPGLRLPHPPDRREDQGPYLVRVPTPPPYRPVRLYGLLFTIALLFALQGDAITSSPLDIARIALPLLVYFAVMWAGSMTLAGTIGLDYPRATTLAFTAAGNNFELAIAVAIATFGASSGQALAGVVGPLIEVPALIALVHVALRTRRHFTVTEDPTYA